MNIGELLSVNGDSVFVSGLAAGLAGRRRRVRRGGIIHLTRVIEDMRHEAICLNIPKIPVRLSIEWIAALCLFGRTNWSIH